MRAQLRHDRQYDQSLRDTNITDEKVFKVINELKQSRSQGQYHFYPKLIKETINAMKEPLFKIF